MGFLSNKEALNFEKMMIQRKWEIWADDYPIAFEMMYGNKNFEEKVAFVEQLYR